MPRGPAPGQPFRATDSTEGPAPYQGGEQPKAKTNPPAGGTNKPVAATGRTLFFVGWSEQGAAAGGEPQ